MYPKMYTTLVNAITKALEVLAEGDRETASWILEEAQREAENIFIEWDWEKENPESDPHEPDGT